MNDLNHDVRAFMTTLFMLTHTYINNHQRKVTWKQLFVDGKTNPFNIKMTLNGFRNFLYNVGIKIPLQIETLFFS